jgi:hypothetical protein
VCAEASAILVLGTYQGASTIARKAFDLKRSRISMLEVEAVPQNCIPKAQIGLSIVLYMRICCLQRALTCVRVTNIFCHVLKHELRRRV